MQDIPINESSKEHSNTSKADPICLLICPKCQSTCPFINFQFNTMNSIDLIINCSSCKTQSMPLSEYNSQKIITINYNCCSKIHKRRAQKFCSCDNKWYCEECLQTSHISHNKHLKLNFPLRLECEKHEKKYIKYCIDCKINICEECIINDHKNHQEETINHHDKIKKLEESYNLLKANGILFKDVYKYQREHFIKNIKNQKVIDNINSSFEKNKKLNEEIDKIISSAFKTSLTLRKNGYNLYELMYFFQSIDINIIDSTNKFPSEDILHNANLLINYYNEEFIIKPKYNQTYQCLHTHFFNYSLYTIIQSFNNNYFIAQNNPSNLMLRNDLTSSITMRSMLLQNEEIYEDIVSILQLNNYKIAFATKSTVYIYDIEFNLIKAIKEGMIDIFQMILLNNQDLITISSDRINKIDIDNGSYEIKIKKENGSFENCCVIKQMLVVSQSNHTLGIYEFDPSYKKIQETKNDFNGNTIYCGKIMIPLKDCDSEIMAEVGKNNLIRIWKRFDGYEKFYVLNKDCNEEEIVSIVQLNKEIICVGYKDVIKIWKLNSKIWSIELKCEMRKNEIRKLMIFKDSKEKENDGRLIAMYDHYIKIWNV